MLQTTDIMAIWTDGSVFYRSAFCLALVVVGSLPDIAFGTRVSVHPATQGSAPTGFNKFGAVYVINLESRPDRLANITRVLQDVGLIDFKVIKAVPHPCGLMGCVLSHILVLQECIESGSETCLVFEDDFLLSAQPHAAVKTVSDFFAASDKGDISWDVVLLSSNLLNSSESSLPFLRRVVDAQTTSSYAVKRSYARHILRNFLQSAFRLNYSCDKDHPQYALDIYWKRLQSSGKWFVFSPMLGHQAASYSDIEYKFVDYGT